VGFDVLSKISTHFLGHRVEHIHLARTEYEWKALMHKIMELQLPLHTISSPAQQLLAPQKGCYSTGLVILKPFKRYNFWQQEEAT
jgi:hypothetical protein